MAEQTVVALRSINQIVAVGSVDGVLTTAALLRVIGTEDVGLAFTQAFAVDKLDISKWQPERNVAFVDLAVNNRDHEMTRHFIARLQAAGHNILAIIDEHDRSHWLEVFGSFDNLIVEPQSQAAGTYRSSAAILKAVLDDMADSHTQELLDAADSGDRMDFSSHFGGLVNQAVKSDIANDTRRVYLARHFAVNTEADATILGWIEEYKLILANHEVILAAKQDLGDGIVRVVATDKKVDMTTLMGTLYKAGAKVVVLEGMAFNKSAGRPTLQISFGTGNQALDLMAAIKGAGITPVGGFAQKVNVDLADEANSLKAVRALL